MEQTTTHVILVKSEDEPEASALIERFFQRTTLVNYDRLEIVGDKIIRADDPMFFPALDKVLDENLQLLRDSIDSLEQGGCHELADILSLTDPYLCKVFHIAAHLVDGFIGIDSVFYSIVEDSHRVSARLRSEIQEQPERYRLLWVHGYFGDPKKVSLLHS